MGLTVARSGGPACCVRRPSQPPEWSFIKYEPSVERRSSKREKKSRCPSIASPFLYKYLPLVSPLMSQRAPESAEAAAPEPARQSAPRLSAPRPPRRRPERRWPFRPVRPADCSSAAVTSSGATHIMCAQRGVRPQRRRAAQGPRAASAVGDRSSVFTRVSLPVASAPYFIPRVHADAASARSGWQATQPPLTLRKRVRCSHLPCNPAAVPGPRPILYTVVAPGPRTQ